MKRRSDGAAKRRRGCPGRVSRAVGSWLVLISLAFAGPARAEPDFLLIDHELRIHPAGGIVLDEASLTFRDDRNEPRVRPLTKCLAITQFDGGSLPPRGRGGVLVVSDGQRLPGILATGAPGGEMLAWEHPWLGRLDVPIDRITAVTFHADRPPPTAGDADVIELLNGDRIEGFVLGIGDPILVKVDLNDDAEPLAVPLDRAAGVAIVSSPRRPRGQRVWLNDGSLLDALAYRIGDDGYVKLETAWAPPAGEPTQVRLADVAAILFDPERLVPLGAAAQSAVEGPALRYDVPEPRDLDERAPLGLGRLEYRGPLLVRYSLPVGCRRFATEAIIPEASRVWGDFELILRDDESEVYRRRFNGDDPSDSINVALSGSELTIELGAGAYGPIQDRLILHRAMLLVER